MSEAKRRESSLEDTISLWHLISMVGRGCANPTVQRFLVEGLMVAAVVGVIVAMALSASS